MNWRHAAEQGSRQLLRWKCPKTLWRTFELALKLSRNFLRCGAHAIERALQDDRSGYLVDDVLALFA